VKKLLTEKLQAVLATPEVDSPVFLFLPELAPQRGADSPDRLSHRLSFVGSEVIEDHHVARLDGRDEDLLDIGAETLAVDGSIKQAGRVDAVVAQGGEESRGLPLALRDLVDEGRLISGRSRSRATSIFFERDARFRIAVLDDYQNAALSLACQWRLDFPQKWRRKIPQSAGWRSALRWIGASVLWRSSTALEGRWDWRGRR
jgi:hypothetical protein